MTDAASMLRRYGPLAAGVLIAQVLISWILIETLLAPGPAAESETATFERQVRGSQVAQASAAEERRLPHYYAPEAFRRVVVNPARTNASRFMMTSLELGLKSYDRSRKPPKDDVTKNLGGDAETLAILDKYASKMRSIMIAELGKRGIDEFDRQDLIPVQEAIRERINREVLRPAFPAGKAKREVVVVEVLFTEMVIQ